MVWSVNVIVGCRPVQVGYRVGTGGWQVCYDLQAGPGVREGCRGCRDPEHGVLPDPALHAVREVPQCPVLLVQRVGGDHLPPSQTEQVKVPLLWNFFSAAA